MHELVVVAIATVGCRSVQVRIRQHPALLPDRVVEGLPDRLAGERFAGRAACTAVAAQRLARGLVDGSLEQRCPFIVVHETVSLPRPDRIQRELHLQHAHRTRTILHSSRNFSK
uniref:Uncharacterized protein n=1 Tax=Ixodes ricinus TaxID=34613 RepID=A0A6B0UKX7_IXORI